MQSLSPEQIKLGIIMLLVVVLIMNYCSRNRIYRSGKCRKNRNRPFDEMNDLIDLSHRENQLNSDIEKSLYDTVQDTRYRGQIPKSNQPNHVLNRWKTHYSHARGDYLGRPTSSRCNSDLETPMWIGKSNMRIHDNSSMYLTSRFAGTE